MILRKSIKTPTLFFFGAAAVATWSTLQNLVNRSGRASDLTDFGLGVLYGVGIGLMLLVAWRSGRRRAR